MVQLQVLGSPSRAEMALLHAPLLHPWDDFLTGAENELAFAEAQALATTTLNSSGTNRRILAKPPGFPNFLVRRRRVHTRVGCQNPYHRTSTEGPSRHRSFSDCSIVPHTAGPHHLAGLRED